MTKVELDKYLESIGGLVNGGWNEPRPPIYSRSFSTGDGWNQLIKDLIESLVAMGWDRKITQVKEKFGGLRFYTSSVTSEMREVIFLAEQMSFTICERCGEPGKLRCAHAWELTLCDKCDKVRGWPIQ